MEDSVKCVFLDTKKLDTELMVKCLQAILNNLPNFQVTCINRDEKFLGYRVHFSSPDEEAAVLEDLKVSGQRIRVCPLKTFLSIHILTKDVLSHSEIEDAIGDGFGYRPIRLSDISPISESGIYRNEKVQGCADIPEIKAQEKFQDARRIILTPPDKKSELTVILGCMLCKKDDHVTQYCNKVSAAVGSQTSNDGEHVLADSTMKPDINIESPEAFTEKIGREEIMKTGYFSADPLPDNKYTPEKNKFKKKPVFRSSAGGSGQNPTTISNNSKQSQSKSNADEEDDIPMICQVDPGTQPSNFEVTSEVPSTKEKSNPLPVPSVKKRKSAAATSVEDMIFLSEPVQECINNACENFGILSREKLQNFFHHVKKKSTVRKIALKFVSEEDLPKLKELLKKISLDWYTLQKFTKEDQRFIKWLDERINKFDMEEPQKRKRTTPNQDAQHNASTLSLKLKINKNV